MTKNEFIQSLVKDIIMVHVESNYTIDTRLVQKIVSTASCVAEDVEHVAPFDKEPVTSDEVKNDTDFFSVEELEEGTTIEEKMRETIIKTLQQVGNNRKIAAQMLGISERTLYRKMKEYNL